MALPLFFRRAFLQRCAFALVGVALAAGCAAADAQTIRIARQSDAASLDPHAFNESVQLDLLGNVYEPLVGRNPNLSLAPALAAAWQQVSPTVWRFQLRGGVQFHDGTPFTADDVVYSFERAMRAGSGMQGDVAGILDVRALGAHEVEIETRAPRPTLPEETSSIYIMGRAWCQGPVANAQADRCQGPSNIAVLQANGTGPFRVRERRPGVRTVFERHRHYWAPIESNAVEIVYTPIPNDDQRVDALLAGRVDVVEPVPLRDLARVQASARARAVVGPELRTLFLGMDQRSAVLADASVKGANPFKDLRVRQAFYQAIDIEAIRKNVMRGTSMPAALLVGPGINGYAADVARLPYDVAAAKKLMAAAGYAQGFALALHCPLGSYVNDGAVCAEVARQLGRIGVQVRVQLQGKDSYFPRLLERQFGFYLLGWTPATYDAGNAIEALMVCPDGQGAGQYNLGGYCNPKVDALAQKIRAQADRAQRNALIREVFALHAADVGHIPLQQQALAWGVGRRIKLVQLADNSMPFKWMRVE